MTVYVDQFNNRNPSQFAGHMVADTREELDDMARKIGLKTLYIQNPGTPREHYDLFPAKRKLAIKMGAEPVSFRKIGEVIARKRQVAADDQ